jgi:hypothetical protein
VSSDELWRLNSVWFNENLIKVFITKSKLVYRRATLLQTDQWVVTWKLENEALQFALSGAHMRISWYSDLKKIAGSMYLAVDDPASWSSPALRFMPGGARIMTGVKDLGAGMSSDPITGLFTVPTCRRHHCAVVAVAATVHSVAPRLRLFNHVAVSRGE